MDFRSISMWVRFSSISCLLSEPQKTCWSSFIWSTVVRNFPFFWSCGIAGEDKRREMDLGWSNPRNFCGEHRRHAHGTIKISLVKRSLGECWGYSWAGMCGVALSNPARVYELFCHAYVDSKRMLRACFGVASSTFLNRTRKLLRATSTTVVSVCHFSCT